MKPIPVSEQFSEQQKSEVERLWYSGLTQEKIANHFSVPRRTIMKLCKHLRLKRTIKQAAEISCKSPLDTEETIQKIRDLRNTHSLDEIVAIVGGSVSAVQRICDKYGIKLDKELYASIQGERMRAAWTPEKKDEASGSNYPELNDRDWLVDHYINKGLSMGKIAKLIGAPLMSVSHHLRRHNIPRRSKEEYLRTLRRCSAIRKTVRTKWGAFILQSNAEVEFVEFLSNHNYNIVCHEPIVLEAGNSQYVPDFEVDGELIEIKPPEYAIEPNVDRQRLVKQMLIAEANKRQLRYWYRKIGFFEIKPIQDIDKYFCLNWKLLFNSPKECFDFLMLYGFHGLQWNRDMVLLGLDNLFRCENPLNANYPNINVMNLIQHFSPHYWSSTHKDYNTIEMAFQDGNKTILLNALEYLWTKTINVNIYGLVRTIAKRFKDFTTVSIFKPWVADYIYKSLLPNGGIIVDPCMGWGGRLLGTLNGAYQYIGFDLNPCVIESHKRLRDFVGAKFQIKPIFNLADAAVADWPIGDLLFTSPPYDDTEYYGGLKQQCIDSTPIYENIMKFDGIIALNVPKRHRDKCVKIANKYGRSLTNEYQMKTSSFIGREATFEPILVFGR
ncbi:MAG: hypothetical protein H7831_06690 [Magnetococcus sp. WYHC-3]